MGSIKYRKVMTDKIGRVIKRKIERVSRKAIGTKPKTRKRNNDFIRNRDVMKPGKG